MQGSNYLKGLLKGSTISVLRLKIILVCFVLFQM